MWRPRNETPEDRQRELAAARRIEAAWNTTHTKLSEQLYEIDWAFFRDGVLTSWGEYKFRTQRYSTLLLSAAKLIRGRYLSTMTGVPFILFIEWPEGLYWYKTDDTPLPIHLGGNNRGQNGDKEPCVHINTSLFKRIRDPS